MALQNPYITKINYNLSSFDAFIESYVKRGFPWTANITDVDILVSNFQRYKPYIVTGNKYNLVSFSPSDCNSIPDTTYNGSYIYITSNEISNMYVDKLTDIWTEKQRMQAKKHYALQSPYEMLMDTRLLFRLYQELRKNLHPITIEASPIDFRKHYAFLARETRNFRLTWIKGLLALLVPIDGWKNKRWLDISSGWGDRLLAACMLDMEYTGFDPNTQLQAAYKNIINIFGGNKSAVYPLPFEESDNLLTDDYYDLVLSSPPFFDFEIYSNEETQSNIRYPSLDSWLQGFLYKSIDICIKKLRKGGVMALYLGDSKNRKICQPLYQHILNNHSNITYKGVIGLQNDYGVTRPCWIYIKHKKTS